MQDNIGTMQNNNKEAFVMRCTRILSAVLVSLFATSAFASQWYLRICPKQTETNAIDVTITAGGATAEVHWHRADNVWFYPLPSLGNVQQVHIHGHSATVNGDHKNAYICIGYRDHIVKHMDFDDSEDQDQSAGDTDDCKCAK